MVQIIFLIIFLASLCGMLFILLRKIPALVQLPQQGQENQSIKHIKGKIGDAYSNYFEKQVLLHKFLSRLKILVLKVERKIDTVLHGIRKKTQEVEKKGRRRKEKSPVS